MRAVVRMCVCVCVRVMSSLWPEIKNSVTRPDDLLQKLKGVDEWSERDSGGKKGTEKKKEKNIGETHCLCRLRHSAELNK